MNSSEIKKFAKDDSEDLINIHNFKLPSKNKPIQ